MDINYLFEFKNFLEFLKESDHLTLLIGLLVILGAYVIISLILFPLLNNLYMIFLRPRNRKVFKKGDWAVVTGASDGIGLATSIELAKRGYNLVMISRSIEKLTDASRELEHAYPNVSIKIVSVDFTESRGYNEKLIRKALQGLTISLLINNAGMSYPHADYYEDLPFTNHEDIVAVNISAMNLMTFIVLPILKKQKRGILVNISSGMASVPQPLYASYGATKEYVRSFSKALEVECRKSNSGVIVQCMLPLLVATRMTRIKKGSLFVATPRQWAKSMLDSLGYDSDFIPWWRHRFHYFWVSVMPAKIIEIYMWIVHVNFYKKWLKKVERSQKNR